MADLEKKQEKQEKGKWGGARPGGGRPKGSTNKLKIADYMSDDDIKALMARYLERAQVEDRVMIHLIESLAGKPRQNVGLDGGEDNKAISIVGFNYIKADGNSANNKTITEAR